MMLLIAFLLPHDLRSSSPNFAWTQAAPDDMLSIRAIVIADQDPICPEVDVDGQTIKMVPRKAAGSVSQPLTCELQVSRASEKIQIGGLSLPVLKKKLKKIAVIGDTGCRVSYLQQQNCNSVDEWPLVRNVQNIATHNPDLIIHVGDLLYRQSNCRDKRKCGSVYGYGWSSWNADWFTPADGLFSVAPFLFVRGNHEDCERAHRGWFEYFDSHPFSEEKCNNFSDSWFFDAGRLQLFVFDSSFGSDSEASDYHIENLRKQFVKLSELKRSDDTRVGFLTHRPLWNYASLKYSGSTNVPQIEAFGNDMPDYVSFILSGHIHIAQVLEMAQHQMQIIAGNGGALLGSPLKSPRAGESVNLGGFTADKVSSVQGHGFAIIDLDDNTVNFYDTKNVLLHKQHIS